MKALVITHGSCPDGSCAAWVAHPTNLPRLDLREDTAEALVDGAFALASRGVRFSLAYHEPEWMRGAVRRLGAVGLWAELLGVDFLQDDEFPAAYGPEWSRGYRDERVAVGRVLNSRETAS